MELRLRMLESRFFEVEVEEAGNTTCQPCKPTSLDLHARRLCSRAALGGAFLSRPFAREKKADRIAQQSVEG